MAGPPPLREGHAPFLSNMLQTHRIQGGGRELAIISSLMYGQCCYYIAEQEKEKICAITRLQGAVQFSPFAVVEETGVIMCPQSTEIYMDTRHDTSKS